MDQVIKVYKPKKDTYVPVKALNKANLHIKQGEFVVLVGASGAGKSTILKLLTCQELPTSGKVLVGGIDINELSKRDIPKLRRKIGFIFQDFKLLPKKTVVQNIAFALEIVGIPSKDIRRNIPKAIKMVNLEGREYSLPAELSGGEMQRVAIARALMNRPKILLADEPTGNLDPKNTQTVIELLRRINHLGTTVILATHDQSIVKYLSQRTVTVANGRIYENGQVINRIETKKK